MKEFIRLLIALFMLSGLRQISAQVSFAPATNYAVGEAPFFALAADLNGDGYLDLIGANYEKDSLTVLSNNGLGVFYLETPLNVGSMPSCAVAADINGDGYLDLISANYDSGSLSVMTNNGRGGFRLSATLQVGVGESHPIWVSAADLNGDGYLDLICAASGLNELWLFTNNGHGVFTNSSAPKTGIDPSCVAAGDLNNDGFVDLISANYNDTHADSTGTLTVLTNNGRGAFGSNATLQVGGGSVCVVAADVNGDGYLDLISANSGASTLTILTNNGSGVFGLKATLAAGIEPCGVVAADINGDGYLDLICANYGSDSVKVFTNNGSGVFGSNATLNVATGPNCLIAADINGDGKLDLITPNDDGTISVLINTSIFPPPVSTPPLSINPQGRGALVSWPTASAGWSLQQNSSLTKGHWLPSGYGGYGIFQNGTNYNLLTTPATGNLFFRLSHP